MPIHLRTRMCATRGGQDFSSCYISNDIEQIILFKLTFLQYFYQYGTSFYFIRFAMHYILKPFLHLPNSFILKLVNWLKELMFKYTLIQQESHITKTN